MFFESEDTKSILVIDPDSSLRDHLDQIFNGHPKASFTHDRSQLSYWFEGCECGQIECALETIEDRFKEKEPYELIFIESRIDGNCGLELIKRIWHLQPDQHVVLCFSDCLLDWKIIVETLGETDQLLILEKPYSELELRQIVHAIVRKHQLNKQSQNVMEFMEQQIAERTRQIEEANQNLLQSEKLASIGQLAAGVAHEINNPLGYIYSNLNSLKQYIVDLLEITDAAEKLAAHCPDGDPEVAKFNALKKRIDLDFLKDDITDLVNESLEGSQRAKNIVQDLRDFSRLDSREREFFDLEAGVDATLNIVNNEIKYKANVIKDYGGILPFECIGAQLNQVFMNMLVNAAQAMDTFGEIIIRTRYENEDWLWIEFEDNGKGMPDEVKDKIFDPFFTTKPVGQGTGLGLSLSYKMIKEHNGRIDVFSKPGVGTRFRIWLPIDPDTTSKPPMASKS